MPVLQTDNVRSGSKRPGLPPRAFGQDLLNETCTPEPQNVPVAFHLGDVFFFYA
jgi:hypothetical protein